MSDSDLSDAPSNLGPSDIELEASLRKELRKTLARGEEATVRSVREASEKALGLVQDFYKGDKWKTRSKDIILDEHAKASASQATQSSPVTDKAKPSTKAQSIAPKRPPKRPTNSADAPAAKKRKPSPPEVDSSALSSAPDDIDDDSGSEPARAPQKKSRAKPAKSTARAHETKLSNSEDETDNKAQDSDSEMSVVLDDEPTKRRRSKSKDTSDTKPKKPKPASKAKPTEDNDPGKEEIKKLQGWLVKCGVRKVWGKELKPYETSKAKIKHLQAMLAEVGMTGRFSNDKAAQIKEARELAADIEAVQEGNQRWGKDDSDEADANDGGENRTRGGRRLVRGAKNYDFLTSDGEEID